MAAELENRCPICLDSWEEASYVMPCLHQFCHLCIVRWAEMKPECPLCKKVMSSILHSVRADSDFQELVIAPPEAAQPPATLPPPTAATGDFYAYTWAFIFRAHPTALQALLPWLHQELGQLFRDTQEAAAARSLVLSSLRCYGLDGEALAQMMWVSLGRRTSSFVHQLVDAVVRLCSEEARRHMGLEATRSAEEWEGSPTAAPSPAASPGGYSTVSTDLRRGPNNSPSAPVPTHGQQEDEQEVQEEAVARGWTVDIGGSSASRTDLRGGPGNPPSAPVLTHRVQEETQEDLEEAVARPSSPRRSSQRTPGRPRRAPKRRASDPEDTSQPCKKPPRRQ